MFGLERWLLRACLVSMMISRIKKTKEKKKKLGLVERKRWEALTGSSPRNSQAQEPGQHGEVPGH